MKECILFFDDMFEKWTATANPIIKHITHTNSKILIDLDLIKNRKVFNVQGE